MRLTKCALIVAGFTMIACDDDDPIGPSNRREEAFAASLSSANEVSPPVAITSSATGMATLRVVSRRVDEASPFTVDTIYYHVEWTALTDSTKGAHIHGPASSTQNASVILNFAPPTTTFTAATLDGSVPGTLAIPAVGLDSLASLFRSQNSYVNVHSKTYTAGEIRGQVTPVVVNAPNY